MGQGERNRKEESRRSRQTSHATGVVVFSMRMVVVVVVFSSRAGLIFSSVPVAFLPVVLFRQYEATRK